jgi:predicted TPR repeat methyltransferase
MIEKARLSGFYAELELTDLVQGLRNRLDASADLILAADTMIYVADLVPVLAESRRVLAAGGLLAFTTETHAGAGVILGEGLRYAHAAAHVREAVAASGLTLSLLEHRSARTEDNIPVPGLVAVATKP